VYSIFSIVAFSEYIAVAAL